MDRSAIQYQKEISLSQSQRLYGAEKQCEAAMEKARRLDGFN
jgi:hypothetical protein